MELFALYTVALVLMKQTMAFGILPGCSCGVSPICPPPVICPPRICPPCLSSIPIRPISTCCQTCICSVRRKRDFLNDNNTIHEMNPVCNSNQLMIIMEKKIGMNAMESAFAIKKAADFKLGAEFNVFCATDDLTHVAHAENFCQHKKGKIICFAYKS